MKTLRSHSILFLAAVCFLFGSVGFCADSDIKKPRPIPFHGTLGSVSPITRSFVVGKRTFFLTPESKIYKGENKAPASLAEAVVGGRVTGSYLKAADGKLLIRSFYLKGGAVVPVKSGAAPKAQPAGAARK